MVNNHIPPIYFYIDKDAWPDKMPEDINTYWPWITSHNVSYYQRGIIGWPLQAYLHLKNIGFPCELTNKIPEEGIVIGHRYSFPDNLVPSRKLMLVCILLDKRRPGDKGIHPFSQIHIVQNLLETKIVQSSYFIYHWLQESLIARDPKRNDKFENVVYFGSHRYLARELRDFMWERRLKKMGINFIILNEDMWYRWNDYSYVDAVLAVRSFNNKEWFNKPTTKLVNAWHAGIPAILGYESAYRSLRKSELDYIEVNNIEEAITALKQLRDDKELYRAIVKNGRVRAQEITSKKITEQWKKFLLDIAIPAYYKWYNASSYNRNIFLLPRVFIYKSKVIKKRLKDKIALIRIHVGIRSRLRLFTSQFIIDKLDFVRVQKSITRILGPEYKPNYNKVQIDITYMCNLKCCSCNRSCSQALSNEHMSLEQIKKFIEESINLNKKWEEIRISGGEPTLHPQIYDIIEQLVSYKANHSSKAKIILNTNGFEKNVKDVIYRMPKEITIYNEKKKTPHQKDFYSFNSAPIDLERYKNVDYLNVCWIPHKCGIGLTRYGYYYCAVAGGIDRIFGFDIGIKKLSNNIDSFINQIKIFCKYCGHFKRFDKKVKSKHDMSITWENAYERCNKNKPTLSLY